MAREFKNDTEKFSYALAMNMSAHLLKMPIELDREIIIEAVTALLRGNQPDMSQEDYQQTMQKFQATMEEKANAEAQKAASENSEKGKAYLAENAKKEGVVTTPTGLQYKCIEQGWEYSARPDDAKLVTIKYRGRFINGYEFDSNESYTGYVSSFVPGFAEGLKKMNEFGKFEFYIPYDL
jgi:FKBP-type peptidyl-prolyl cis-trans isomerase